MRTVTLRQVRHDFGSVLPDIEAGDSVEVSKRGKIIALISPPLPIARKMPKRKPDFLGRLKRIYGEKPRPGKNPVLEDRESHSL